MAEALGEAVLYLRTDDSQLDAGMGKAHAGAKAVQGSFDRASASSGRLTTAMATTGKAAATTGAQFQRTGTQVTASAGAQRAGMQQLSMQLNDVATMYALGARPQQIFASQAGQVLQAVQLMTNGTSKLAAFLGGPWGMAITTATIVLVPFIGKLFEADRAAQLAEEGADALGKAQSTLGQIFDLVTGKLREQNEVLIMNARIMAANLRVEALAKRAAARGTLIDAQAPANTFAAQLGTAEVRASATSGGQAVTQLLRDIGSGKISRADAVKQAESMDFSGTRVTRTQFMEALLNASVANMNERVADMIDQSLDSGELAPGLRQPGKPTKPKKDTGPTEAEITRRFNDEIDGMRSQIASSEARVARSVEERAELELKQVDFAERATVRAIEADKHYTESDKRRLTATAEMLAEAERASIEFRKRRELEQEAEQLADEQYRATIEALQVQGQLADTEAGRKQIALEIFDTEQAFLKSKLEALAASETATDAERERARQALAALNATAGSRRDAAERANETEVERYLRHLDKSSAQINEAIDGIKIDGLEALNDGLVDAMLGVKSLGSVFSSVAKQIIGDLMRIAIQKAIIGPLANTLFGGTGGITSLLGGTPFAGLFADGGLIPAGSFGIVGERGPEPVIGTDAGAMVLPNSTMRGGMGGGGVVQLRVTRGEMFDVAVEQVAGQVSVQVVREAAPGLVEVAAAETTRRLTRPRM